MNNPGTIYIPICKVKLPCHNNLIISSHTAIIEFNKLIQIVTSEINMINTWSIIWDKVFKNGPSKICGRQPLKNLKEYGLF